MQDFMPRYHNAYMCTTNYIRARRKYVAFVYIVTYYKVWRHFLNYEPTATHIIGRSIVTEISPGLQCPRSVA